MIKFKHIIISLGVVWCLWLGMPVLRAFSDNPEKHMTDTPCYDDRLAKIVYWVALKSEREVATILASLEDPKVLDAMVISTILDLTTTKESSLDRNQQGVLLSLCLYQHCRQTERYWTHVQEYVGEVPYLNLFLDGEDNYKIFSITPKTFLFVQLVGRGAHNGTYLVWLIHQNEKTFHPILLPIPLFDGKQKPYLLALTINYEAEKKQLIVRSHGGYEDTYGIDKDKLTLLQSSKRPR